MLLSLWPSVAALSPPPPPNFGCAASDACLRVTLPTTSTAHGTSPHCAAALVAANAFASDYALERSPRASQLRARSQGWRATRREGIGTPPWAAECPLLPGRDAGRPSRRQSSRSLRPSWRLLRTPRRGTTTPSSTRRHRRQTSRAVPTRPRGAKRSASRAAAQAERAAAPPIRDAGSAKGRGCRPRSSPRTGCHRASSARALRRRMRAARRRRGNG